MNPTRRRFVGAFGSATGLVGIAKLSALGTLIQGHSVWAHSGQPDGHHTHDSTVVKFMRALDLDDEARIRELLLKGFNPNVSTEEGVPALSFAMLSGAEKCVRTLLLSNKLDVNQSDLNGDTPLMIAAILNKPAWVARLLSKGATQKQSGHWTALHYAATSGAVEAMDMLLLAGAQINALSPNGTTPLMMAARENQDAAALFLMERRADALLVNQSGFTAAGYASASQNTALAQAIEQYAASATRP